MWASQGRGGWCFISCDFRISFSLSPLPTPIRFLRSQPLVRLGFVLYLLVLHLWVLVVLGWHTHNLELDEPLTNKRNLSP